MSDITTALRAIDRGEKTVEDDLLPLVYEELRRLAAARFAQQGIGQTLQPTALVHEAWLQLSAGGPRSWQNRAHFFGAAADAMRQILIDNARRKSALKRGGDWKRVDAEALEISAATPDEHILLISEALERLEAEDPGKAANGHQPNPATLWRVTVESWLRCQGLIVIRQNQNVSTTLQKIWSHN